MLGALVIGESLIDIVEQDGRVLGEHVGGSPLNVAVGLGRLGHRVDFVTRIGDDAAGARILAYLRSAGVRPAAGSVVAGPTATARAILDDDKAADYHLELDWRLSGNPATPPPAVVHTGSLAAAIEPGCLAVAALLDTYRPAATVSFDPNIRPALLADRALACERIQRLVEGSDIVKVSAADLNWIEPDRPVEQVARNWLAAGPSVVAVTLGERGAFALCAAGIARVDAEAVAVADTIGAGDAFTVGLLDALSVAGLLGARHRTGLQAIDVTTLGAALRSATDCAALTVARRGADLPDRATLDGYRARRFGPAKNG
ncbi:carbohydrate kinase [Mycolicibacillus trivialis]